MLFDNDVFTNDPGKDVNNNNVTYKKKMRSSSGTHLWHLHLCHIRVDRINRLVKDGKIFNMQVEYLPICQPCLQDKTTRNLFR